jgi:hypothetical protein
VKRGGEEVLNVINREQRGRRGGDRGKICSTREGRRGRSTVGGGGRRWRKFAGGGKRKSPENRELRELAEMSASGSVGLEAFF